MTSRLSADCQKVGDQVQLNVNVFLRSVIQVPHISRTSPVYLPYISPILRSVIQVRLTLARVRVRVS